MTAKRSVGSMAAVADPSRGKKSSRVSAARVKELLLLSALIVSVTAGGVALGVYGVSPLLGKLSKEAVEGAVAFVISWAVGRSHSVRG